MIKLSEIESKYGDYLVDENKLKELLLKPEPKTIRDLENGDRYFFLNSIGEICCDIWVGSPFDLARRECCNAFLTEEEIQFEIERKKCEAVMLKYGRRTFKYEQNNFSIKYDHLNNCIGMAGWIERQYQGNIYYDTEELAKIAINEIGVERLKKYVFRVEE